jgi:hypothetical protein
MNNLLEWISANERPDPIKPETISKIVDHVQGQGVIDAF